MSPRHVKEPQPDEPIRLGSGPELEDDVRQAIAQLEARKARRAAKTAARKPDPQLPAAQQSTVQKAASNKAQLKQEARKGEAALPTVHRPLTLLEVTDPADLDALLADARVSALVTVRLDPRAALVRSGDEAKLTAALRRAGHIPRVLDDASGVPEDAPQDSASAEGSPE